MTVIASRETRQAREDLQAAQDAEAAHRGDCIECGRAASRRQPADRCADGAALAGAVLAAEKRWRHERELDAKPVPGQEALF